MFIADDAIEATSPVTKGFRERVQREAQGLYSDPQERFTHP